MTTATQPRAYLSVYTSTAYGQEGQRVWQVHYQGLPLCAATDEQSAREVWESNRNRISQAEAHLAPHFPENPPVWDGDLGQFS